MDRVIDTFGPENYGTERVKIIYSMCQDLTDDELELVVDHMIKTIPYKYPPLPQRFLEEIHNIIGQRLRKDVQQAKRKLDQRSGLKETLERFGAKSLVDAINKVRE